MSGSLRQTWDGLQIAADQPYGSTVVVRRPGPGAAEPEYLLMHRKHRGPDYEGDWAWTSPAGARQPGEPVYQAALRELAEEAGLTGIHPWAVDLSGRWAVFGVDVARDVPIELVDPEHDRFEWVSADEAMARVIPGEVASSSFGRMRAIDPLAVTFSPMTEGDLEQLLKWRSERHVTEWFGPPLPSLAAATERYANRICGDSATRMWLVRLHEDPIGYVQDYRVSAYDDYAVKIRDHDAIGFDYLIGEPDRVGRGVGTAMIWAFMRDVLCRDFPEAPRFTASPDYRNARSLRALEKCGLEQGLWIDVPQDPGQPASTEIVCTLDRHRWFGSSRASIDTQKS